MQWVWPALASLLTSVPVLLVWLAGIAVAAVNLPQRRRAARLLVVGLAAMFVLRLITLPLYAVLPIVLIERGWSTPAVGRFLGLMSFANSLAYAVAWVLVIAAVFVREAEPSTA
jgi:hypothetical protein